MEGSESKGFTEITLEDEVTIARQAGLAGQLLSLKTQLYAYLQSYTKGSVTDLVTAGQEERVFEVFRQIADKGRSRRPEHVLELRNRVFHPTQAHPQGFKLTEVEGKLAQWESDRRYFYQVTKEKVSEDVANLIAIKHCSGDLREHLTKEIEKYDTLHKIKAEISNWVARKARSAGTLSMVAPTGGNDDEGNEGEHVQEDQEIEVEDAHGNLFAAIVRKTGLKVKPGQRIGGPPRQPRTAAP